MLLLQFSVQGQLQLSECRNSMGNYYQRELMSFFGLFFQCHDVALTEFKVAWK
jgi:hypothetical protein